MLANKIVTQNLKMLVGDNHHQQSDFEYISWIELVAIVTEPPVIQGTREELKSNCAVIAAHNAAFKTKEAALLNNAFTLLRLDLDNTKLNADDIAFVLQTKGIESYLIHTTASHQYKNNGNRYRVYLELSESLTYKEWANCETYLASLFIDADDCASKPSQIMYLPFYFDGYHYLLGKGKAITKDHILVKQSQSYCEKLAIQQADSYQKARKQGFVKSFKEKLIGTQISIIDLIEQGYAWEFLLSAHQYKRKGKAWLAPESSSKIAGAYLLQSSDGKVRFYSHHSNDPCATGKAIDKLDFIAIREYGGNRKQAIKTIAQTYFPQVHKHNFKEWKINRLNGGAR